MELRVGNKYRLGRKIGSGSFGDIFLGVPQNPISLPPRLVAQAAQGRRVRTTTKFTLEFPIGTMVVHGRCDPCCVVGRKGLVLTGNGGGS